MLGSFSRLSLLWKILLATSIALTMLFALVGWIVQDNATRAMSASVDEDVQASFRAYDSLWRSRAQTLAAVSLVISRMSDVRAAFSTGDQATIRDSADELWKQISNQDAIFLVTDPEGRVLASLGGSLGESLKRDMPAVRDAAASFPRQTSGFVTLDGHLYQIAVTPVYVQAAAGMGLLNVLVAGYEVNRETVRSLKDSTGGSDFCFLSGAAVVASTLDPSANASMQAVSSPAGAVTRIEAGGTHYTMLGTPLLDVAGRRIGELRVLRSSEGARQRINALGRDIIIAWLIAVLGGLLLTYSLARRILRPVKELDRGATEVSQGNYDYRIPVEDPDVGTHDELGRLAAAFNAMCASIQDGRQELIRQERIATIGRLSTSIVHDLRNPLAAIYGGAEMLIDGELTNGQVQRLAGNIYRSSRRMQQLLQELVDTGRGRSISTEVCRLRDIVFVACEVFAPTAEAQSVTIEVDVPDSLELPLERARMERVFLNLIDNSLGVMPMGGTLRITAKTENSSVIVSVQDTGPGIPSQIRARLFQPFVSAGKKNGIGLGLAFSHQTVLDHGGRLWADPDTRQGACFLIQLPL
ncbi:MAG TPA: ATP-binding protein [Bryobacteraceae bacterium]|jgi:signal transduction histidine kinase|nr:ATP-binding protein [Bryobacteraceae bacterium]